MLFVGSDSLVGGGRPKQLGFRKTRYCTGTDYPISQGDGSPAIATRLIALFVMI